ncbi:helix-turn-helix domain protein [Actinobacteria bacterium OV450]|nr:helix-turn-helix domain protein [Actinobacteria bacterium OV450]
MVNIRDLDPSASPLDYYGSELRRLREEARLKQGQLGEIVFCTASLIGQIETARKVPTRDFSERVDAALDTNGAFSRLVGLVLRSQLPTWFQPYAEMEAKAAYISSFQAQLVYGLLQTEEYARAVLGAFTVLRFDDDPDLVYTEDFVQGHMTANPQALREGSLRCDHLQAAALSVEDSAALIARVMEERYGHHPGPDERAVA